MSDSSVVRFADRAFACGLTWLVLPPGGGGRRWTVRHARSLGATWYAERGGQTGFWTGEEPEAGLRPLASLADLVTRAVGVEGEAAWKALVECDAERFLVVRGRGEAILPDGDEVVDGIAEARAVFGDFEGWERIFATPALVPDAEELPFALEGVGAVLAPVPFARGRSRRRLVGWAVAAASLAALAWGGLWIWEVYEELTREVVVFEPEMVDKRIVEGVDAGAFLDGCIRARRSPPVLPPVWEPVLVECRATAEGRGEIAGLLPEGALFIRWRMKPGANDSLARRVAEQRLEGWDLGGVLVSSAWGAMGVSAPIRSWPGEEPSTVDFRGAIDRSLGTIGSLSYVSKPEGFEVVVRTMYPLAVVRERMVAIRWLALVSAEWNGTRWQVVARRVVPRVIQVRAEEGGAS